MKKILINVGESVPVKDGYISGIGKSIYWLIQAINKLYRNQEDVEFELYASGFKSIGFDFHGWHNKQHTIPFPQTLEIMGGRNLPCLIRKTFIKCDLFHITDNVDYINHNESVVTTIHDLDAYLKTDDLKLKKRYEQVARQSRRIACCSEYTKQDVVNHLGIDPQKIDVIYWGCSRDLFRLLPDYDVEKTLEKFQINGPYFFSCSCSNPRKNVLTALRAYKKFLGFKPEHKFILVWGNVPNSIMEEFASEISTGQIIFLPFVSDDELVALYNAASLSIYVSRREGFGFPILESFACGTPVMTCANTSLVEVGKDAAIYVGEDDIDSMVDIMKLIETNSFDRKSFLDKSSKILSQFTWDKCADSYVEFYKKAVEI